MTAWAALEDAAYCRIPIGRRSGAEANGDVGVFVGVTTNDYPLLGLTAVAGRQSDVPRAFPWSIANRVSFFLNFNGPSMPVDTGCSSSLVAIHLACESLKRGECSMAIAGGVNAYLHPNKYLQMNSMRMLSSSGRCHPFGAGGDGFVPGEGVGAVVLRPLRDAQKNNDHIYAVIKATAMNHGGRSSGYTQPNPGAQAKVILSALKNANLHPRTISYIEAHGTGTALGDPIEIEGISKALGADSVGRQWCAIGSVKSNIGHLEAAAGIAGLMKVMMQMKHKELVPSIHASVTNPNINFVDSPVYLQQDLAPWKVPQAEEDGTRAKYPRRAGVSSFGAGGVNAHVILEEYESPVRTYRCCAGGEASEESQVAVLSARNEERLRVYAATMVRFLEREGTGRRGCEPREAGSLEGILKGIVGLVAQMLNTIDAEVRADVPLQEYGVDPVSARRLALQIGEKFDVDLCPDGVLQSRSIEWLARQVHEKEAQRSAGARLSDVAYTLQIGREPMEERLAAVVNSVDELIHVLREFCRGTQSVQNLFLGSSKQGGRAVGLLADQDGDQYIETLLTKRKLAKLADLWVHGVPIDWPRLYATAERPPQRISLPTYPFAEQACWLNFRGTGREDRREESMQMPQEARKGDQSESTEVPDPLAAPKEADGRVDLLRMQFKRLLGEVLYTDGRTIDERKPFAELGLDSVLGVELINRVNREFHLSLKATSLYDHSTVRDFAQYLNSQVAELDGAGVGASPRSDAETTARADASRPRLGLTRPGTSSVHRVPDSGIAVIGMSGRFPGADDVWELWDNLRTGRCAVGEVPAERWDTRKYYHPEPGTPNKTYCKWGGFLKNIDAFDPLFFGISPAEAVLLEPQQRLFLQEAWRAIEDAGYSGESLSGARCGVCAGVMSYNEYNPAYMFNATSILAARIAYFLNLKGPSYSVDTGCSSSLLAVHLACQHLISDECDMMLAGGVTLYLSEKQYVEMSRSRMLSPRGRCSAFDDGADGFVPAEGVGVVVLKPLRKALQDGDHIYGVIRASGSNQDGRTNGITAPSAESQKQLELGVYKKCGINPRSIDYVEAHGTGTHLGDPIELQGLTEAFREYTRDERFCFIGSIKNNLGHTGAAAGIVSLMKVLLAMKYRQLPPLLHFTRANRHIGLDESPFVVNTSLSEWVANGDHPRRAAVSSFGYSGTNVHLVIDEAPVKEADCVSVGKRPYAVVLSAAGPETLQRKISQLATWLECEGAEHPIKDVAYTLATGRTHFPERWAAVVESAAELAHSLRTSRVGGAREHPNGASADADSKAALSARRYLKGETPNWGELFDGEQCHRVPMPTYPFLQNRYWFSSDKAERATQASDQTLSEEQLKRAAAAFLTEVLSKHETPKENSVVFKPQKVLRGNNAATRR